MKFVMSVRDAAGYYLCVTNMITLLHSLSVLTCMWNEIKVKEPVKYNGIFVAGGNHELELQVDKHAIEHIYEINGENVVDQVPEYNFVIIKVSKFQTSLYPVSNYSLDLDKI